MSSLLEKCQLQYWYGIKYGCTLSTVYKYYLCITIYLQPKTGLIHLLFGLFWTPFTEKTIATHVKLHWVLLAWVTIILEYFFCYCYSNSYSNTLLNNNPLLNLTFFMSWCQYFLLIIGVIWSKIKFCIWISLVLMLLEG